MDASATWANPLWPGVECRVEIDPAIVSRKTRFQKLEIRETRGLGRALFLDDKLQSALVDEHVYHEALVQPAMVLHPAPRSVFIAGGGEGATLREALHHPTVERALMVDIDGEAIEFTREYMADWHQGAFDDPRAEVVIDDARANLANSSERFDVIVVDVTDPLSGGPSYLLFTREFMEIARDHLTPDGVLVVQAQLIAPVVQQAHVAIARTIGAVFPIWRSYAAYVPALGAPWGFVTGSRSLDPRTLDEATVDARLAARGVVGRFYDGECHGHMFRLPKDIRAALAANTAIVTDDEPLFVH